MSKQLLIAIIGVLTWSGVSSREPSRNIPDRTESEVRAFLKVNYPDTANRMTVKYDSESDAWWFFYKSKENCIDCNFSGSITDDKNKPKIIAVVMDG